MTSTSKQVNCCQSSLVDNPLVSVIVPMYNAEKTIQKTLNSLQRQSVSNIEIIIVDDGSTDRGAELVMAIAEGDNRIKLISQNNSGVCVARNRGIDEASGDWVAFVDADDMLPINAVRLLLESSDGCSLVIGALLNEHGDYSGKAISIDWKTACSLSLAFWDNVNKVPFSSFTKGVVFRSVCGKIFKKSLFRNGFLKFEDGIRFGEDALFMVDAYRLAESVKVVDSAVYCYVNNSDSVTRNTDISAIESVDNLLVKLYELCHVNPDLSELYKQSAVREVLSLIRNCVRLESNQLFKPISNMVCQSYFSYLMEGFASHRYSRRFISEVKNRITIRLLLARRVMAAIGFTKFVYGVR